MTSASPAEAVVASAGAPEILSGGARWRIFFYLTALFFLLAFASPSGGLIDIPISFLLKNKLHLTAVQVAQFRLIAGVPLFLSWFFGFMRDVWNPLGMSDRGFLVLFGGASALLYSFFAFTPVTYGTLLVALVLLTSAFLFIASAQKGLTATLGQQHVMSGQISAVLNIVGSLTAVAALLVGGNLSNLLALKNADDTARTLFLVGAGIMALVVAYGAWRPAVVFDNVRNEQSQHERPTEDIKRLLRHWPIYPALLIWLLWNFAPGAATPLQYHMQNTLHASDAAWGEWNAVFAASFIPTFLAYGYLCRRFSLRPLLWWGTVIAVPQMVPLLFTHSVAAALIAAVPMGLMGGMSTAAYIDLLIRSCPRGLQGTTLMISNTFLFMVTGFGDLLGTELYERSGNFTVCVIAITVVYALILPTLLLVPRRLTASADGEALQRGLAEPQAPGTPPAGQDPL
jgi:MFS family permease